MGNQEILVRYRWLMEEAWTLTRQAERVIRIGRPAGIPLQEITGMPHGTNDREAESIQAFDGYAERLKEKAIEITKICDRFESVIKSIKDDRARTVCRMYYGLGMTDDKIARKLYMTRARITEIRNNAVTKL